MLTADEREANGRALAQRREEVVHRVAVFAAGHGDQDAIAVRDHLKVGDRAGHARERPLLECARSR